MRRAGGRAGEQVDSTLAVEVFRFGIRDCCTCCLTLSPYTFCCSNLSAYEIYRETPPRSAMPSVVRKRRHEFRKSRWRESDERESRVSESKSGRPLFLGRTVPIAHDSSTD